MIAIEAWLARIDKRSMSSEKYGSPDRLGPIARIAIKSESANIGIAKAARNCSSESTTAEPGEEARTSSREIGCRVRIRVRGRAESLWIEDAKDVDPDGCCESFSNALLPSQM